MPKESGGNRQMRERIVQLAARLVAADGIDNIALAKRKAARQLGAPETRNLPADEEVEKAVLSYQRLYFPGGHKEHLGELREQARGMMNLLARFHPHLTGPVLTGSAGRYTNIEILLFADSSKQFELFLIDQGIPFHGTERRIFLGGTPRNIPSYRVSTNRSDFDIMVLDPQDLRHTIRTATARKVVERADLDQLNALIASG
ncbi:MAG: hypothetical protein ACKVP2_17880 [Burkholderiales bacterium]